MNMITIGQHLIAVERAHAIDALCQGLALPPGAGQGNGPMAVAVVADSLEGLTALRQAASEELRATGQLSSQPDTVFVAQACGPEGLALLFPGQGAQYPGMLSGLAAWQPFADILTELDSTAAPIFGRSLKDWFFGDPANPANALEGTHAAQAALGFCGAALARLLERFGVKARFAAGHSYGELLALWQGGGFDDAALFQATHARGQVMAQAAQRLPSGLAAIGADEATTEALLKDWPGLQIANLNAPRQTVIGGARDQLAALADHCQKVGIRHATIAGAAAAFHTEHMAPALEDWSRFLEDFATRGRIHSPAKLEVYANVTAKPYTGLTGQQMAQSLHRQVTSRVRWAEICRRLHDDGARVFVEVGPGQVLTKLLGQNLADRPHHVHPCDPRGEDASRHIARLLAHLAAHGVLAHAQPTPSGLTASPPQGIQMIPSSERMVHAFLSENSRIVDRYLSLVERVLNQPGQPLSDQVLWRMLDASTRLTSDHLSANERLLLGTTAAPAAGTTAAAGLPVWTPPPAITEPAASQAPSQNDVGDWLRREISTLTGFPQEAIDVQAKFEEMGIDSLAFMDLYRRLNTSFPVPDELTDQVLACRTIADLIGLMARAKPGQAMPAVRANDAATPADKAGQDLEGWLRQQIAQATGFAPSAIGLDTPLEELGIDSLARTELFERLATRWPAARAKSAALFMAPTPAAMIALLTEAAPSTVPAAQPLPEALAAVRSKVIETLRSLVTSATVEIHDDTRFSALHLDGFERAHLWESTALRLSPYRLAGEALISVGSVKEGMELLSGIGAPEGPSRREPTAPSGDRLQRYLQVDMPRAWPDHPLPGKVLLVGSPGPALRQVAEAIAAASVDVAELHLDAEGWQTPEGPRLALDAHEALAGLLATLDADDRPILFLASGSDDLGDTNQAQTRVDLNGLGLFSLAKALDSRPALLAAHGRLGVLLTHGGSADAAARGVARALSHEWRKSPIQVGSIVLDASAQSDPCQAVRVLMAQPGKHDLRLRDGKLYECIADVHQEVDQGDAQKLDLSADSVVLLFGGAVGIGAEIGIDLARRYGLQVVALGRTDWQGQMPHAHVSDDAALAEAIYADLLAASGGQRPEMPVVQQATQRVRRQRAIARTAARVAEAGGRFHYLSADVTNPDDVEHAIASVRQRFGGIDMVVHAAGLVEDRTLGGKTLDSFRRVLHTKTRSAFNLKQALQDTPPRYIAFFSSLVSHTGNAGQTDYCAGNEVLNTLALEWAEQCPDSRVIAFLWSVWTETGLAGRGVQQLLEKHMLTGISSAEGARRFHAEFTRPTGPSWVLVTSARTLDVVQSGALLN